MSGRFGRGFRGKRSKGQRRGRWFERFRLSGQSFPQCICPNCGMRITKKMDLACYQTKCPRCSSPMTQLFLNEK